MKKKDIKENVRKGYGRIALQGGSCCGSTCDCGYSEADMDTVPEGSNLGLGCGNPVSIAGLKTGEIVLDMGSGAGFDAFLAAKKVGAKGRVIGIDMTPEMVAKAKANAKSGGYKNVEFKVAEIEALPVEDETVDVIISNCVINLSPDKQAVFNEAFRVLKPGGRIMVSDLVLEKELPKAIKNSVEAYVGCIAGAIMKEQYLGHIKKAGFKNIEVIGEGRYLESPVLSIKVSASKP